jgi:hypothetical protein
MTLFPASDESLRPRWEKLRHRAGKGFGKLQKFIVADATYSAFDLCDDLPTNVPTAPLAGRRKLRLAQPAGRAKPANLRPDDVLCGGRHDAKSCA